MIPSRLMVIALSTWFGLDQLQDTIKRWANTGKDFWTRDDPNRVAPDLLTDPAWGNHGFAELYGVKLHIVEQGDRSKPLIIFLHGFPEFWFTWRKALEYFSKDYWVVAPDMRGFGDSDRPTSVAAYKSTHLEQDILQLVKALGKTKAILVGRDFGAVLSTIVAAKNPDVIEKLVIINGAHPAVWRNGIWNNRVQTQKAFYIFSFQIPLLPDYVTFAGDNWRFDDYLGFLRKEEVDCYKYAYRTRERWTTAINYYRNLFGPLPDGFLMDELRLPKITQPTLVLWGEEDEFVDKTLAPMHKDYMENMTLVTLPGVGHFCNEDKPDIINKEIEKFLGTKSRRSTRG